MVKPKRNCPETLKILVKIAQLSGLFCAILCATIVHSANRDSENRLTLLLDVYIPKFRKIYSFVGPHHHLCTDG